MPKPQTLSLDDLLAAAKIGEADDWEFKSAKGGLPRSMWETYSAMANTMGGKIVLGVSEKDGKFSVHGLTPELVKKYRKHIFDTLNNPSKVSCNLLTGSDVSTVSLGRNQALVLNVRSASRFEKPIYLNGNPTRHTYRRYDEGDYVCDEGEVRRMFAGACQDPPDSRVLEHFDLDDIHLETLAQYRNVFRSRAPQHSWLAYDNKRFLQALGAWDTNRETEISGLTVAGLLMFGKEQSILNVSAFPKFFLDYREYTAQTDPSSRWSHRISPDGLWEANLFQFYQRVWPRLSSHLPVPFQLEGIQRVDETPAHRALREAFVNALVHTDYEAPSNIVIEYRTDKFVLANPGVPLVSIAQIKSGGVSECRNARLHKMFSLIGAGERAGSGYNQIQHGWKDAGWRTPHLDVNYKQLERVTLTMPTVSLIPDETLNDLRGLFGAKIDHLNPSQVLILATAHIEGEVTNARIQELLLDHPSDITQILKDLCNSGYLMGDEKRRWTRYKLARQEPDDLFSQSKGEELDSSGLDENSSDLSGRSSGLDENSSDLSAEHKQLAVIAATVSGKGRVPQAVMRDAILKLCAGRFLALQTLAELLNRAPQNLRNAYLTPMVRDGLLRLKYEQQPNHPSQAYTAEE